MKYFYIFIFAAVLPFQCFGKEPLNNLMETWLNLESQKGKLQYDWNSRREQLEQSIHLFSTEEAALKTRLKNSKLDKSDVEKLRLELTKKQENLEKEQLEVDEFIQQSIYFIQSIIFRLPPPLEKMWRDKIRLLNQEQISPSKKLERVLALFKIYNEFDNRIAINRAAMEVSTKDAEIKNMRVTQIYLGVSQGWYVSDDGQYFGYGRPDLKSWTWWHNESASKELGKKLNPQDLIELVNVINNPTTASFIRLPIKINNKELG